MRGTAAVSAAAGTLAILDELAGGITRAEARAATPAHDEHYLVDGLEALSDNGVPVVIPPLYNTLDQPFASSGGPQNGPGLHFVVFVPTSGRFHLARRSIDGILPDGTQLKVAPRDAGINGMLQTTHRQNYLVPPRTHRSFLMAELVT